MKKLALLAFCLMNACGGPERPLTAKCKPSVNVTIDSSAGAAAKQATARREVVQVYWDVSKSMRDFAIARSATRKTAAETDDLTPVVDALDSSVLLGAHAESVEQYGVGETIAPLSSARAALHPGANRTVLHLAAERIGAALASGEATAALVVSDMEVDAPARTSAAHATVCGGVPLPSTSEAGALFGRCFESALLASQEPPLTRAHLLAHVFRKSSHGRELFILLLATDRTFGRDISGAIVNRLGFPREVIFDSGSVSSANVRGCTLTAPDASMFRVANGCGAKCFDTSAAIGVQCELKRPADALVYAAGRGLDGASYSSDPAQVRFAIPCNTRPGRFDAVVSFNWQTHAASALKPSVRDLFDSLADAIARTAAPRHLHIGIDLQ